MYKKEDFRIACNEKFDCGWYVSLNAGEYLRKDLQIRKGTGFTSVPEFLYQWGMAPGYYSSKKTAEEFLNAFLGAQKMDSIEIIAKVNGKVVSLDTISTETFDKMKKASREPKYEGVYTAEVKDGGGLPESARVVFKVTQDICGYIGESIALNRDGNVCNTDDNLQETLTYRFPSGEILYKNIKKLGD